VCVCVRVRAGACICIYRHVMCVSITLQLMPIKISWVMMLLNQARASLWPACDWFLEIAFVHDVSVRVCVSTPEAINN